MKTMRVRFGPYVSTRDRGPVKIDFSTTMGFTTGRNSELVDVPVLNSE